MGNIYSNQLDDFEEAVLSEIDHEPLRVDAYGEFQSKARLSARFNAQQQDKLSAAVTSLIDRDYVEEIEETHTNGAHWNGYRLTPLGRRHITRPNAGTSYSVAGIANIAHNSPNATQTINLNALDDDLKTKITELEEAIKNKDKNKIKQVFGYIADKSVDVAIALMINGINH